MWRLTKLVVYLVILAGVGLVGYAYVGPLLGADFLPQRETVTVPVELEID